MKRKLIRQGTNALTITLPSEWIKQNKLTSGDEIRILNQENTLTISTENKEDLKEIALDVSGLLPRLADRFMARSYQKGYDKIMLTFDDPEAMTAVKKKIPELMGYEIFQTGKNYLEIQILSTNLDIDFDTILRRAFLLLLEMTETCMTAWKQGDKQQLEHITQQDFEVNKFTYFCLRHLNKSANTSGFGNSILYHLIESMEDLGDELKVLGNTLAGMKPEKDVLNILKEMNNMFRMSYDFFYKPKKELATNAYLSYQNIKQAIQDALETNNKEKINALIAIEFSIRILYHLTTMRLDTIEGLSKQK